MATYSRPTYSEEEIRRRLSQGHYGVLSLIDAEGLPYGVPLNYVYHPDRQALYFHAAKTGRKIRALTAHERAHFVIVLQEEIVPPIFVTHYDSLMLEGRLHLVQDDDERRQALTALCDRHAPDQPRRDSVLAEGLARTAIIRFDIETASGKANRDE